MGVEESDEESTAEDLVLVKLLNEEVWQAFETLLTYSLFTENGETLRFIFMHFRHSVNKNSKKQKIVQNMQEHNKPYLTL